MVKYDLFIIEIFNQYIPYLFDQSLDISELELGTNYRIESDKLYQEINQKRLKSYEYYKNKISNHHINSNIKDIEYYAKLYNVWGALQVLYIKNKNTFFNKVNEIDLHGLYQKEAAAVIHIIINFYKKGDKLKIITGKGKNIIFNIVMSVLNEKDIKYRIEPNYILMIM